MGFESGEIVVAFGEGEEVGLFHALADLEPTAAGLIVAGISGLFLDVLDEQIDAGGIDFEGDDEGDHGGWDEEMRDRFSLEAKLRKEGNP